MLVVEGVELVAVQDRSQVARLLPAEHRIRDGVVPASCAPMPLAANVASGMAAAAASATSNRGTVRFHYPRGITSMVTSRGQRAWTPTSSPRPPGSSLR